MNNKIAMFCGLNVGKSAHHASTLDREGGQIFDHPPPQNAAKPREVFTRLQAHGPALLIVDQADTIGALPIAVAREAGCEVASLPGLTMRKAVESYPGRARTDVLYSSQTLTQPERCLYTPCSVAGDSAVLAT